MKKKSVYYLVGNAHIDPVWQWRWQEGSAEALSTMRSALDRMNEFPDYTFVCSSAVLYRWVEEFAPDMFEEIKQRVAEGRFIPVGGMHVEPDCNNPSGEGFARQTLYSQRFFKEKLGVTAKVGYNVDSFGHNLMLPQILRKSGMTDYIFMRPGEHEKVLEQEIFDWVSPDGSSVTAHRILDGYGYNFRCIEDLVKRMDDVDTVTKTDCDAGLLFYGVGNHGGGPTIKNLKIIEEYKKTHPETKFIYSDITDFFDYIRASGVDLPKYHDDLQHHASGCYASLSAIKIGIRRGEVNLISAENIGMIANTVCGRSLNTKKLEEAWNNICFLHFHDSMGGCSIREVYDDAQYIYGASLHTAAVEENAAVRSIARRINTSLMQTYMPPGMPVVLFNPHGFDVEEYVRVFRSAIELKDCNGNDVPFQKIYSTTEECFWRTDTLFKAKVPAMGYAVYYLNDDWVPMEEQIRMVIDVPDSIVKAIPYKGYRTANNHEGTILESDIYRIEFELHTGYIISFVDKRTGNELISDKTAVPVVIDEYYHDIWSHGKNFFTDRMARFSDAEVTVVEGGPLRATVKVVSRYNQSKLTGYFSLEPGCDKLHIRYEIDWHEKHKMLKIAWPMKVENPKAYYEIPFGVAERPADGEEEPGLMWTAVKGENGGFALINSDTYSSSVEDGTIYQTVIRSPIYGDGGGPRTSESEFTEQGIRRFSAVLMPVSDSWVPVIRTARQLNKPLTFSLDSWHKGDLSDKPKSTLNISAENIMLSACKRSEDGTGIILRLYETDGKKTPVTVSGKMVKIPLETVFTPWSMRTFYLGDESTVWKEVLITEYDYDSTSL